MPVSFIDELLVHLEKTFNQPQHLTLDYLKYITPEQACEMGGDVNIVSYIISTNTKPTNYSHLFIKPEQLSATILRDRLQEQEQGTPIFFITHIEIFNYYLLHHTERFKSVLSQQIKYTAFIAKYGRLDLLKTLYKTYPDIFKGETEFVSLAASNGHLTTLKFLCSIDGIHIDTNAMDFACEKGHLHIVKWLHENRTEGCTTYAMDSASIEGHLNIVKWLHKHRQEGPTNRAIDCTAYNGHLDVIRFLHENRGEGCTTRAIQNATHQNQIHVVKFLCEYRCEGFNYSLLDYLNKQLANTTTTTYDDTIAFEIYQYLQTKLHLVKV